MICLTFALFLRHGVHDMPCNGSCKASSLVGLGCVDVLGWMSRRLLSAFIVWPCAIEYQMWLERSLFIS